MSLLWCIRQLFFTFFYRRANRNQRSFWLTSLLTNRRARNTVFTPAPLFRGRRLCWWVEKSSLKLFIVFTASILLISVTFGAIFVQTWPRSEGVEVSTFDLRGKDSFAARAPLFFFFVDVRRFCCLGLFAQYDGPSPFHANTRHPPVSCVTFSRPKTFNRRRSCPFWSRRHFFVLFFFFVSLSNPRF